MEKNLKPSHLEYGDTIGFVTPASAVNEEKFYKALETVQSWGFKVKTHDLVLDKYGYLAGSDQQRAKQINDMFADPDVKAIFAVRGGFGVTRMLHLVDYDLISQNPKILIGFSDLTALIQAIYVKTGLIGFHGSVATSVYNEYSVGSLLNVVMSVKSGYVIENYVYPSDDPIFNYLEINQGKATGRLIGGNLSLMVSLLGTEYDIDYTDKIVFIEEIDEPPYKIDRMLTQLFSARKFDNASAVILGIFNKCSAADHDIKQQDSLDLIDMLKDKFSGLKIPVVYGFSFGHIEHRCIFPVGIEATIDTTNATVTLNEAAVI